MKYYLILLFLLGLNLTNAQIQMCGSTTPSNPISANSLFKRVGNVSVPVFFHIILATSGAGDVTDTQLGQQIDVLNNLLIEGSGYQFYLAGYTKTRNDSWRNLVKLSQDEIDMKNSLGVDPTHALNIYVTSTIDFLGWTYFPEDYSENSLQHGVIVRTDCLPNGGYTNYDQGKIAVHEAGHYLGLYHTFDDFGACKNADLVDDTPIHQKNIGCPNTNPPMDTCPQPGLDPINNLMNYTNDPCRNYFTPGQFQRIKNITAEHKPSLGGNNIYINLTRSINYGDTWKLVAGNYLFSSGCYLIVNGTLNAIGTTSNPIIFTRSGSSNWGGIQFNSGSGGIIQYCTISNATQGIYIQETNSLSISNSEIFNCSGHGMYVYRTNYAVQPAITNCNIHDNSSSTGIVMYWSSPDIRNSNIYNNYNGLGIADFSSPRLGHTNVSGNNNIHNNSNIGVYSKRYSNPLLGRNLTPFEAGNNIIASNTFRDAQAEDYCNVYAENNWWGSSPPNSTKIAALSGSMIDYDPYLSSPPSLSMAVGKESIVANDIEKRIVTSD